MYDLVFGRVPIDGPMVVRLDHACPLGLYMGQSFLGQWAPPPPIPTQTLNVAEERIYIISFCPIPSFFFLFFFFFFLSYTQRAQSSKFIICQHDHILIVVV
jgi:hypothetical protein